MPPPALYAHTLYSPVYMAPEEMDRYAPLMSLCVLRAQLRSFFNLDADMPPPGGPSADMPGGASSCVRCTSNGPSIRCLQYLCPGRSRISIVLLPVIFALSFCEMFLSVWPSVACICRTCKKGNNQKRFMIPYMQDAISVLPGNQMARLCPPPSHSITGQPESSPADLSPSAAMTLDGRLLQVLI